MQNDVVYFDGVCNLCSASVRFIIKRDKDGRFKFAPLQGDYALSSLGTKYLDQHALNGLVLQRGQKIYTQSSAALQIARYLNGAWPLFFVFWIVPKFLRDAVYGLIARNRYKWFGKQASCWLPNGEILERFL